LGLTERFFGNILSGIIRVISQNIIGLFGGVLILSIKYSSRTGGFTLVELMVVIVILGILLAIGVTQMASATRRARDAGTKTNMHAFQTVVEIYAVNYNGHYPETVEQLSQDSLAQSERTLFAMANTHGYGAGLDKSYTNETGGVKLPGIVSMQFDSSSFGYTLYGYDSNANKMESKGVMYLLSNH
jgi:prepilin-type N-terminal cleavage/methylation domain-containing protein